MGPLGLNESDFLSYFELTMKTPKAKASLKAQTSPLIQELVSLYESGDYNAFKLKVTEYFYSN